MEYYSARKKNELASSAGEKVDETGDRDVKQSEANSEAKHHIFFFLLCGIQELKNDTKVKGYSQGIWKGKSTRGAHHI
jgi:hypothetical protein